MGLDQPHARRGGGKNRENKGVFFFSSDGTAAVGNELLERGWGFLSSSHSPPLFLLLAFVPSVCKFTIYINSCLGTRENALSHIERRRREIREALLLKSFVDGKTIRCYFARLPSATPGLRSAQIHQCVSAKG